jgi:hypothetical protein
MTSKEDERESRQPRKVATTSFTSFMEAVRETNWGKELVTEGVETQEYVSTLAQMGRNRPATEGIMRSMHAMGDRKTE